MEELNNEANFPKLIDKSPATLVAMAKRLIINDSNINVVIQAIRLVGYLAKGQQKCFESYAKGIVPVFFMKFRDKKSQVIQEVFKSLDNLMHSINIDSIITHIETALQDKVTSAKVNLLQWIEKTGLFYIISEETGKIIFTNIKAMIDDGNDGVRDAVYSLLNKFIQKYPEFKDNLSDLPTNKMKKIINPENSEKQSTKKIAKESSSIKAEKTLKLDQDKGLGNKEKKEKKPVILDDCENIEEIQLIPENILTNLNETS